MIDEPQDSSPAQDVNSDWNERDSLAIWTISSAVVYLLSMTQEDLISDDEHKIQVPRKMWIVTGTREIPWPSGRFLRQWCIFIDDALGSKRNHRFLVNCLVFVHT